MPFVGFAGIVPLIDVVLLRSISHRGLAASSIMRFDGASARDNEKNTGTLHGSSVLYTWGL